MQKCIFWKEVILMIKEKYIQIPWRNATKKRYEKLGYVYTKEGDFFNVKVTDLPLFSEYEVTVVCDNCLQERNMTVHTYNHITQKQTKSYICRECFLKNKILKYEEIEKQVVESGYIMLTKKSEFKNGNTYIRYACPKHGEKTIRASNFHNGKRCPDCCNENLREQFSFTPDYVYNEVKKLGGELLNKEEYINNKEKNMKILCPRCHKNILITSFRHFIQHGGQSCQACYRKESVGERRIRQWLELNNIDYEQEKWFKDCKDIKPLPFDFYLPERNTIIEYDGKQHFEETHFFSFQNNSHESITSYIKNHDLIKNNYCKQNNINLIRIPYTSLNNLEQILQQNLIA